MHWVHPHWERRRLRSWHDRFRTSSPTRSSIVRSWWTIRARSSDQVQVTARRSQAQATGWSPRLITMDPVIGGHRPIGVGRRSRAVLVAAATVLIALLVAAVAVLGGPSGAERPTPAGTPTSPAPSWTLSPSASPTRPSAPPQGFRDCSSSLGLESYCVENPECWTDVRAYADAPRMADNADCNSQHLYQTFAAGSMEVIPRRQSQLEAVAHVQNLCSDQTLAKVLGSRTPESEWEIFVLPPQNERTQVFRCIAGRGMRDEPLQLRKLWR